MDIDIPPVRSIFTGLPEPVINNTTPITLTLGVPIVDMPGCVEVHPDEPGLIDDDPNGVITLCDGQVPSFNPIDYNPKQIIFTGPPEPISGVKIKPDKKPETTEVPYDSLLPKLNTPEISIPAIKKKEEIVEIKRDSSFIEKYLPEAEEVATTVIIATAAATAAVLGKPIAELILRIIKPTIRKVINKIQKKLRKNVNMLSTSERRQLQRNLWKG